MAALHCFHCSEPVRTGDRYRLEVDGEERRFCCPACQMVAETILGGGLQDYYRFRDEPAARPEEADDYSAYDEPLIQQQSVQRHGDGSLEVSLLIEGMHCAACVWLLEQQLQGQPGVRRAQVSLDRQRAMVHYDGERLRLSDLCRAIARVGYRPRLDRPDQAEALYQREQRLALRRLGVAGIGMMQAGMFGLAMHIGLVQDLSEPLRDLLRWVSAVVATPVVLYSAQPFFVNAWHGLRRGRPGMDVPVALAIGLAYVVSLWATWRGSGDVYFDAVGMFTFLLLGGRYLEMRARHYSGRRVSDLNSLLPGMVLRIDPDSGEAERVALASLVAGDVVLVQPGQTVPADGTVLDGQPRISSAVLTGEFEPRRFAPGEAVSAGSVNGEQPFRLRATATGADLRLHAVQRLMQQAAASRAPQALMADLLARVFVLAVLAVAALVFGWWWLHDRGNALWVTLSVLVVTCPCALSLATPTALTAATNALRRAGCLVTESGVWERAPRTTDVVFDKTGTLTRGVLTLRECRPLAELDEARCRELAAALEVGSSHPIALAFGASRLVPDEVDYPLGRGALGRFGDAWYRLGRPDWAWPGEELPAPDGQGLWLLLADERRPLAWFGLDDALRPEAAEVVAELQGRGLRVHLLSGDPSPAAARLGEQLGMDEIHTGASPEDKLEQVIALQRQGRRILMVGDGVNDLPVLAQADIGVAMQGAPDLAKTQADCILLQSALGGLPLLLDKAVATRRTIAQNLAWALGYNGLALPAAAAGLVPPWLAALGMSASSLIVVLNALRLQRIRAGSVEEETLPWPASTS